MLLTVHSIKNVVIVYCS